MIEATGTTFRATFGTAFKAPSLAQRFQDFPAFFFFGNRDLRPEESRGMDVGFEQALFQGRARTGLTYFRNSITDLIQLKSDFSSVENIAQARTSGIETFASTDLSDTLRLRADYTYTEAINEANGRDLIRRPRHKASLAVGWQALPPLLITTSLLYVGERFDGDRADFDFNNRPVRQPSFTTVNVAADYKVNDHVSLIGRVDNLLDKEYEDPNGFLRPGVGAYAGVRLRN
ncbi:MAG: TonB-dependent receptor [Verrucomicrobiae bacterium]|nr:TonB-dependent receptor [Verrucomicrobiae bacterium]